MSSPRTPDISARSLAEVPAADAADAPLTGSIWRCREWAHQRAGAPADHGRPRRTAARASELLFHVLPMRARRAGLGATRRTCSSRDRMHSSVWVTAATPAAEAAGIGDFGSSVGRRERGDGPAADLVGEKEAASQRKKQPAGRRLRSTLRSHAMRPAEACEHMAWSHRGGESARRERRNDRTGSPG